MRTTAWAAMPSSVPVKPRPSSVVALTLMAVTGTPMTRERFWRIWGIWGMSLGFWARMVMSAFSTRQPFWAKRSMTFPRRTRLSAPL